MWLHVCVILCVWVCVCVRQCSKYNGGSPRSHPLLMFFIKQTKYKRTSHPQPRHHTYIYYICDTHTYAYVRVITVYRRAADIAPLRSSFLISFYLFVFSIFFFLFYFPSICCYLFYSATCVEEATKKLWQLRKQKD